MNIIWRIMPVIWAVTDWVRYHLLHRPYSKMMKTRPRSSQWPALRRAWLSDHPACAVCGSTRGPEAHHVESFSQNPAKELDATNLVTLCRPNGHHLLFGHLIEWRSINPHCREDVAAWAKKIQERP
jgi:hypothetical protein